MTKKIFETLLVVCFMSTLFFGVHSSQAEPITRYVDLDFDIETPGWQNTTFDSINDAIDASNPYDIIYIYSGLYTENIQIDTSITILGENQADTILQAAGTGHVLSASGTSTQSITVNISDLTLTSPIGTGYDCIAFDYVSGSTLSSLKLQNSPSGEGIQLTHSTLNTIQGCTITDNSMSGIVLISSSENTIQSNVISNNQKGIYLQSPTGDTINNVIKENTITSNSQWGIRTSRSDSNTFYENDFTTNGEHANDPSSNTWYHNGHGNYWGDYSGTDSDSDGIGDTPYAIPGGTNVDYYPLGYFPEGGSSSGNNKPVAYQPTITPNPAIVNQSITFIGGGTDSDGSVVAYRWESNIDGVLSTQQSFTTTALSIGSHTISFSVRDNDGAWSDPQTKSLLIQTGANQVPIATITSISPNPAVENTTISFSGSGADTDGIITAWKWISNIDGVLATQSSFSSSSLSVGTHTIRFMVRDDDDEWSTATTETLQINSPAGNTAPTAIINELSSAPIDTTIVFNGENSTDPDGTIISYVWDFGDGTSAETTVAPHLYTQAGTYTVTLTIQDDKGATSEETMTITITTQSSSSDSSDGSNQGFDILDSNLPPYIFIIPFIIIGLVVIVFLRKLRT